MLAKHSRCFLGLRTKLNLKLNLLCCVVFFFLFSFLLLEEEDIEEEERGGGGGGGGRINLALLFDSRVEEYRT